MTVKAKGEVENRTIKLSDISANTGQTRGFGVIPQLKALGYGVFEKASVEADKEAIWPMLTSTDPKVRKKAAQLVREHEPDIVNAAESQETFSQLQAILVVLDGDGKYDVVAGMTRCFARALNHAEDAKAPDTVDARVLMERPKDIDLKLMGFAENNDRRNESPIDKAIFFKECRDDFKMTPDDIGKKVGLTGQSVRDYMKMLHPKLADKVDDIHNGTLSVDKAKKLLKKRKGGEGDDEGGSAPSGQRARFPSVKKIEQAYSAKKKPEWMEQKEWELFTAEGVRIWVAFRLGKKYKPFTGEVLTVVEPEPETPKEAAKKVLKLTIPQGLAVKLLAALGKPEAEDWTLKQLTDKLESIVNLVEPEQSLQDEKLNGLLQKLVKHYKTGLIITIKEGKKAQVAA